MDEADTVLTIEEFLASQGKVEPIPLREHLDLLRQFDEGLYERNAGQALEDLDETTLSEVPVEIEREESPDCIVYYLPDQQLLRVLPDYPWELEYWEELALEEPATGS